MAAQLPHPDDDRLPAWLRVGFSGHRHLANPDAVEAGLRRALDAIEHRTPRLLGVSSAAFGADTLFAEEILRRQHPLRIVLPFTAARFQRDFAEAPGAWERSRAVIDAAIDVDVISPQGPDGQPAEDAYLEAGIRTVDDSDVLIAAWDQQPVKGRGGTADVVAYARLIGRPVILINPETGIVSDQDLQRIRASAARAEAGATSAAGAKSRAAATSGPEAGVEAAADATRAPRAAVQAYYADVNRQAERHAPIVRELMRWCVLLHLGASTVTTAALIFGAKGWVALMVTGIDTSVLALAFVMLWMRGRRHREWRRLRAAAEVCRSALAVWDIRRNSRPAPRAPLPGLGDLSRTLDVLRQLDRSPAPLFDTVRNGYEADRIGEQIDYFKTKHAIARRQVRRRKILMTVLTAIGIASALTSAGLLAGGSHVPLTSEWLDFLGIVAPLGASALGVLLITDESARRHERYAQMVTRLESWRPRLRACRTWDSLGRLATMVEDELLQEVLEWRAFATYTEHVE